MSSELLALITCPICKRSLSDATGVPCCPEIVCANHIQVIENNFICPKCNKTSPVPTNGLLKYAQMNKAAEHLRYKENAAYLIEEKLKKILKFDKNSFLNNYFEKLKENIMNQRETILNDFIMGLDQRLGNWIEEIERIKEFCLNIDINPNDRIKFELSKQNLFYEEEISLVDTEWFKRCQHSDLDELNLNLEQIMEEYKARILGGDEYLFEYNKIDCERLDFGRIIQKHVLPEKQVEKFEINEIPEISQILKDGIIDFPSMSQISQANFSQEPNFDNYVVNNMQSMEPIEDKEIHSRNAQPDFEVPVELMFVNGHTSAANHILFDKNGEYIITVVY